MTPQELVKFRNDHKMTQQALADVLGCTWQAIRFWEFPVGHKDHRRVPKTTARVLKLFSKRPELMSEFRLL